MGLGALGSSAGSQLGDLFLAFSMVRVQSWRRTPSTSHRWAPITIQMLPHEATEPFFGATAEATEEAVVNAMLTASVADEPATRRCRAEPGQPLQPS
jgi:D-aminopeptidase